MSSLRPTQIVPPEGLPYWSAPDPSLPPLGTLAANLQVTLENRAGDWAQVKASNGWHGWVDARRLVAAQPPAPPDDGLLDILVGVMDQYRTLVEDLAAQRIDDAEFRKRVFEAGMVARDGQALMFDLDRGCWARYDGITITFGESVNKPTDIKP
jgi:hypothetical protein